MLNPKNPTRLLIAMALFVAMDVTLNFFSIRIGTLLEINLNFLALALAGYLLGPWPAMGIGVLADIIGYMLNPSGPFFLGFTFNALLSGLIYGLVLFQKPIKISRVLVLVLVNTVVFSFVLVPIWLNIMYGSALISSLRALKAVLMYPVEVLLIYSLLNLVSRYQKSLLRSRL